MPFCWFCHVAAHISFLAELPMKALPVLRVKTADEEKVYCQSSAIAKFFAREHGKRLGKSMGVGMGSGGAGL